MRKNKQLVDPLHLNMGTRTPSYHSSTSSVPDQEALTDELSDIASSVESLIIRHDDADTSNSDTSSVSVQDELVWRPPTLPRFGGNFTEETNTYYLERAVSIGAKLANTTTFFQSSEVHLTNKWNSLTEEQVSSYRGRNADTFSTHLCCNTFTFPFIKPSETHDECCIC